MVRLKVRWIIARVEHSARSDDNDAIKMFRRKLRSSLTESFGVSTVKVDLRVALLSGGIAMIRVYPISAVPQVRACLTLGIVSPPEVLAIKGCARTAKLFAVRYVRNAMRRQAATARTISAAQRREWDALEQSIGAIGY